MENQDISQMNAACKSLKEKLQRSLGNDLIPLLEDALQFSVHPTLEDAALELSRSELLFVALLQALRSKNTVMSGRLLLEAEDWKLLPRLSGYMGGKLRTEFNFNCTSKFVGGAALFAHTLQNSGLIKVPEKYLEYLDYLAEAGAAGEPQEADDQDNQRASSKRDSTNEKPQTHDQAVQTESATAPSPATSLPYINQDKPTTNEKPQTQDQAAQTKTSATTPSPATSMSSIDQFQTISTTSTSPMLSAASSSFSLFEMQRDHVTMALLAAVESDDPETIRDAIESGANIDTALHVAAAGGQLNAMSVLLKAAADTEVVDSAGDRPLHTAAANGLDKAVALLVVAGADLNAGGQGGLTPILRAAGRKSTTALLRTLAYSQVQRDRAVSDEATQALWKAVERNDPQAAKDALEKGADIERRGSDDSTVLHQAALGDRVEVLSVLLRGGANKEAVDSNNDTPLHWAAGWGCDGAVAMLAVAGADLHCRCGEGRTPLQWAADCDHSSTVALLRSLCG